MKLKYAIVLTLLLPINALAQQERAMGLRFLDPLRYQSIPLASPPTSGPLPDSVDLSGDLPEIGDQGRQGSCVAWATGYAMKSYQKNREARLNSVPTRYTFSPSFIFNQIKLNSCNGGSYIVNALDLLETQGDAFLQDFPYDEGDCSRIPTDIEKQNANPYRIASWRRINPQSQTEVKSQLAGGFPVVVAVRIYHNFFSYQKGQIYNTLSGAEKEGHAMLVVGYDDRKSAYKIANSWSKQWGDSGFVWIDYGTFQAMTVEAYVAVDIFLQVNQILTPTLLSASLKANIAPDKFGKTSDGHTQHPFSVWLELPPTIKNKISSVEYNFNYPGFVNPKRPPTDSSIYIVSWIGWGCIDDADVAVHLNDGGTVKTKFSLCKLLGVD